MTSGVADSLFVPGYTKPTRQKPTPVCVSYNTRRLKMNKSVFTHVRKRATDKQVSPPDQADWTAVTRYFAASTRYLTIYIEGNGSAHTIR